LKEFGMLRILGIILMLCGIVMVIIGIVSGQSGDHVPNNPLGLFNWTTAISFFGGLVATFVGFALAMINGPRPTA
jgi:hypothetical protein